MITFYINNAYWIIPVMSASGAIGIVILIVALAMIGAGAGWALATEYYRLVGKE